MPPSNRKLIIDNSYAKCREKMKEIEDEAAAERSRRHVGMRASRAIYFAIRLDRLGRSAGRTLCHVAIS